MENSKKQIIYYIIISSVSFSLGLLFDNKILCNTPQLELQPEHELEIVLQEDISVEKDKKITTEEGCTIYVDASGALKNPGVYCLENDALVIDVVNKAGGFSKDVASKFVARKINLSQPVVNSQKLYFPFEKELVCQLVGLTQEAEKIEKMFETPVTILPTTEPYIDQTTTTTTSPDPSDTTNNSDTQCVNINTASKEQLITLNGVGESTAGKIIEGRPYANINDLLNVSGIGEATLNKFKDKVCI